MRQLVGLNLLGDRLRLLEPLLPDEGAVQTGSEIESRERVWLTITVNGNGAPLPT